MRETKRCIACGKPTKMVGGHVLLGDETVYAGWCSEKCLNATPCPDLCRAKGCFGGWHERYGVKEEDRPDA